MISYHIEKGEICNDYPFLTKVFDAQTASGYIVNKGMYDKLINLYEWSVPLLEENGGHWLYANDIVWKSIQPESNWYCFTERMGIQRGCVNDNTGVYTFYGC